MTDPPAPSSAPTSGDAPVSPGDLVAGKYRVERVLGRGAMGLVVAGRHEGLDQAVAIKVVLPAASMDREEARARFYREARAVAKLTSERVARVMDVGLLESGAPYMVMEYLEGTDLADLLARCGPMTASEATDYALEVLDALAEAHARGIVHRDLKPANLFRAQRPDGTTVIKVLDFGISKAKEGGGTSLTGTHAMMGSPAYMSPEQILATKEVDVRADVWSMGVVLYELVAGEPPFAGASMGVILSSVLSDPIRDLRDVRPGVPEGFARVVMRCLERDVTRRYQNVGELALGLGPFASSAAAPLVERVHRLLGQAPMTMRNHELAQLAAALAPARIVFRDGDADATVRTNETAAANPTLVAAPASAVLRVPVGDVTGTSSEAPVRDVAGTAEDAASIARTPSPALAEPAAATTAAPTQPASGVAPGRVALLSLAAAAAGYGLHALLSR